MPDQPWPFFYHTDAFDLDSVVPMSFPETAPNDPDESTFLQFMTELMAATPLHSAERGTLQPLPTDPPASADFITEQTRLEIPISGVFTAPAPPPQAMLALPPVALTHPVSQSWLPSLGAQPIPQENEVRCLLGVNYKPLTLQMVPAWVLIPKSLFPLPHGIEAYAQANGTDVGNFRGYVADRSGILPLYVPRGLMGHFCPIGQLQREGAESSAADSYLYLNVLTTSSFKCIYPNLEEYISYHSLTRTSDSRRWMYTSQSKILLRDEVLRDETFNSWRSSRFIPLGSPNLFELSPAAVTFGQWSAWVSNIAANLPDVIKFYPRWAPKLAECLGTCQIVVQCEALCGQFLHSGDLQAAPQNFILPPEDRLRRIWDKVRKAFQLPEIETVVRWNDASPTQPLGPDPFLMPLVRIQGEIGRNIRTIVHCMVLQYLECNRVPAMDFILDTFQLSVANLAAGIAPAVDLKTAERTLVSPLTGCPFAHPLLFSTLHYLLNRGLLLSQPLDCAPAVPRTVAALLRRATPVRDVPPAMISYVATELLTAVLWATCKDPGVAAFPPMNREIMAGAMFRRFHFVIQASDFSDQVKKLVGLLTRAYSLKPRMTQ